MFLKRPPDIITTAKQSTTKPRAYIVGHTVQQYLSIGKVSDEDDDQI